MEFRPKILLARPTVALANKCGYLRFILSSRSQVNSGPRREFQRTFTIGIHLRLSFLTPRSKISIGISSSLTRETCHGFLQVLMDGGKEIIRRLLEKEGKSWNGGLSKTLIKKNRDLREMKMVVKKDWNEKIHHHFHQWNRPMDEMKMDDLEWRKMS
nr:hypothetical protein [Tanacetum cinerariifolium]